MESNFRDAQRAFAGLLARPLVTLHSDPALYRAVQRHHKHINDSARRLGYRVQHVGRASRLLRLPILGEVVAPPPPLDTPTRRVRALACVLAAACEEIEGGVTLQKLSDLVADITAGTTKQIAPYDPNQMAHRRQLVRAAAVLEEWGVLRRRNVTDRLEDWAESRHGIGAGFEVDRDALLMFVSPEVMSQALLSGHDDLDARNASRSTRLLRSLVETPAVLYADLDPRDAEEFRATRGLRLNEANQMIGGQVEARREGCVMLVVDDDVQSPVTVEWPTAATASWLSLVIADLAGRADGDPDPVTGIVALTPGQVDDVVDNFMSRKGEYLSKAYRDDPAAVRAEAERQLTYLGLLRADPRRPGAWLVLPIAGRYRHPDVVLPDQSAGHDPDPTSSDAQEPLS